MEFYEENAAKQKTIERFNLILTSLYILMIMIHGIRENWQNWVPMAMGIVIVSSWILHITQYKNYAIRAFITSVVLSFAMLMYGLFTDNFWNSMTTLYLFIIIIAMYGVMECVYTTMVVSVLMFINHILNVDHLLSDSQELQVILMQFCNLFFFEILIYIWTKDRIRNEKQNVKTIEALKLAERSKDDFLANVSHEVRTPLNTISGMSEIALAEQDIDAIHEYMYGIQTASRNLMSTVSDILDFSELQTGKIALDEEDYIITSTINDIMNMAVAFREDKKIEIIVDYDITIPGVLYGDEKKIRRIIMNIVSNAIKFTKDGGIAISVKGRRENYGVNLIFTVKDTGIGMNEESLERLYTSFGQLDTRRNRQNSGIGLGLAITKVLVEHMGGTLLIDSELGKGTTVQVVLPQKIVEDVPTVSIKDKNLIKALVYIDMEKFKLPEVRDTYANNISTMIDQLGIDAHVCRSLMELKRRIGRDNYNYVFVSNVEYLMDPEYFNNLDETIKVMIVLERQDDMDEISRRAYRVYKPFSVLSIAAVFNGISMERDRISRVRTESFTAPTARILVVDDNYMNIRVIQGLLNKYKIKVEYALSGAEALEKVENMNYDFIFMDHMMPEMDGVETAHRIRDKIGNYYKNVPIIALTANAIAGTREMFLNEGFVDFVEKPVELSVLERVLKRNLPESKLEYRKTTDDKNDGVIQADSTKTENKEETHKVEREEKEEQSFVNDSKSDMDQIKELDIATGELYCGSRENFKTILAEFCESAVDTRLEIIRLYEEKRWNEYSIKVHALKGCMRTIGAPEVADLAYELEMAGKNGEINTILQKHDLLMKKHKELFKAIVGYPCMQEVLSKEVVERNLLMQVIATSKEKDIKGLQALSEEEFSQILDEFESATYELDKVTLEHIADKLEGHQYNGEDISDVLGKVRKKIMQEDYFSAHELLLAIYNKQKGVNS